MRPCEHRPRRLPLGNVDSFVATAGFIEIAEQGLNAHVRFFSSVNNLINDLVRH